jgi:hypothetical protein
MVFNIAVIIFKKKLFWIFFHTKINQIDFHMKIVWKKMIYSHYSKSYITNLAFLNSFSPWKCSSRPDPQRGLWPHTLYINEVFQTCAISIAAEITQFCPYQKAASLWKKKCSLKYLDSQFFSTADIKRLKSNPTVV